MATKRSIRQLTAAIALAIAAATAHGAFFALTAAVSTGAPAAGIRLSTWDDYEKQWSIYFIEQHLNDAVNNPDGTLRHSEGAIIELRPVAGVLTFDAVPAGLSYTVIPDLSVLGITAPGDVPLGQDGTAQPQLTASGVPVYIQLNVSTVATSVPPPVNHVGPWAGPVDPTDDDLSALDAGGSVGVHAVTLGATGDTVSFTWDIGRWAKGDIFLGLNNKTYKVLDHTGHFKRFVATADLDDPDHQAYEWYSETSGCATNWKSGEMFAANFGDGMPAVNVITRHPSAGGRTLYSPLSRRVSTRIDRPDEWSWWGIDVNPESVAFDGNMNMYVGHSFGNQHDRPTMGDQAYWTGLGYDTFNDTTWYPMGVDGLPREWSGGGEGYIVDETGARMKLAEAGAPVQSYVNKTMGQIGPQMEYENDGVTLKFGPAPPAIAGLNLPAQLPLGYLANPGNGNAYQRLDANDVVVEGLVPARWSMGKRLHRYNIQPDGTYRGSESATADRDVFWTFVGRQGTDWIDVNSTGDVLYYTSEDSFIHRYRAQLNPDFPDQPIGQLPDLGNGRINVPGSADRRFNGLRILPPGDGSGGFLVAATGGIHRLRADGSWVQSFTISDDAYLLSQNGIHGANVNGWYSIEVDPGGRTLWAAPTDTSWVYVFNIATGREIRRFEATEYRPYGHPQGARFVQSMCIMREYTAAQEICGNFTDDDGDGFVDENCKAIEVCSSASPGDDNGDGLADANDPDCGADEAPVAVDDFFETVQDVPFGVAVNAANQVLKNDSDPDNADANTVRHDVLTVGLVGTSGTPATLPGAGIATTQGGTVVLNADGSMSYMPAAGFHGLDTFVYQATDAVIPFEGQNYSNTATVTILVRPLVDDDHYEVEQGTSLDVSASSTTPPALLSNDRSDGLTISGAGPSGITPLGVSPSIQFVTAVGGATVVVYADGRFTYTPPGTFVGTDTFRYRGHDGVSNSINDAVVTIEVGATSTVVVTTDPNPSVYGRVAEVEAKVLCGGDKVTTGTVTFSQGAAVLASGVPVNDGKAVINLAASLAVGSYPITAKYRSITGGCTRGTGTTTHVVIPAPLEIAALKHEKTYGQLFTFAGSEFVVSGLLFSDAVTSVTLTSAGTPAAAAIGTYDVMPSAAQGTGITNYTITYKKGELKVLKKALTITANNLSKVYGTVYVFAGTEFVTNGLTAFDVITSATLDSDATPANRAAGTVRDISIKDAVGTGLSNYDITYVKGLMTVTPAPLTITANNRSKVYGTVAVFAGTEFTASGLVNSDSVASVTLTSAGAPAEASVASGPYPIVPGAAVGSGLSNYVIAYVNGTLTVTPRAATVTAGGGTKAFGSSDPALSAITTSGFLAADLAGITLSQSRAAGESVGTYATTAVATGGPLSSYTVTYVPGVFTITPAAATAVATGGTFVYDGTPKPQTCTVTGSAGTPLTGTLTYTPGPGAPIAVGSYTVTCAFAGDASHGAASDTDTVVITPRAATVTAGTGTKVYGTTDPALTTVTTAGFVPADLAALTLNQSRAAGEVVNTYATTASAAGAPLANYTVTYVSGVFTITKAPLVVTANNKTKTEGTPNPVLDGALTGVVAGDGITATYTTTATTLSPVGSYPITPSLTDPGNRLGNYTVTVIPGTLTITPQGVYCAPTGYITYSQGGWGSTPNGGNPGALLAANFATVYPDGVTIGGTFTLKFTSAEAIAKFLPAGGSSKVLGASAVNPIKSPVGVFAGQLLALQLAADFSDKGVLPNGLRRMVLKSGPLTGVSVNQVLVIANQVLGGNSAALPAGMSVSGLSSLVESIIMNYHEGADEGMLVCASGTGGVSGGGGSGIDDDAGSGDPDAGTDPLPVCAFRTQTQGGWGSTPRGNNPGAFLAANFSALGQGGVTIGSGNKLVFTSAAAVSAFLPAGGSVGTLTSLEMTNPLRSSAGVFAGQVLALQISVDFSKAGLTQAGLDTLKLKTGLLAGQTVGQVLAAAHVALGGGALPEGVSLSALSNMLDAINNNFVDGSTNGGYLETGTCR